MTGHSLVRTNRMGVPFRGKCRYCGKENLKAAQALEPCDKAPSPDKAVLEAISPACLRPSAAILATLGSIAVHVDELLSDEGHAFDRTELLIRLRDPNLKEWMDEMRKLALLPVKRN